MHPVDSIDRVWIFPPRDLGDRESGLLVLSLFDIDPDRRTILTLRYSASGAAEPRIDAVAEQGTAPADRVQRVIDGVLRRLGDEGEDPVAGAIGGDRERWSDFLGSLGAVDPSSGE